VLLSDALGNDDYETTLSLIHLAAQADSHSFFCLKILGANLNALCSELATITHYAASNTNESFLRRIIRDRKITELDIRGESPLDWALHVNPNIACSLLLLDNNPELAKNIDSEGIGALAHAIYDYPLAELLLAHNAYINTAVNNGSSFLLGYLYNAIQKQILAGDEQQADMYKKIFDLLLSQPHPLDDYIDPETGKTGIHYAIEENNLELVKALRSHPTFKWLVNKRDAAGNTILHIAAHRATEIQNCPYTQLCTLIIIQDGADATITNRVFQKPLELAADDTHMKKMLMEYNQPKSFNAANA